MSDERGPATDTQLRRAASRWAIVHNSVFGTLVVAMVSMAASILIIVIAFFWFLAGPNLRQSVGPVFERYTGELAARSLDFATAKSLRDELELAVRYEGPDGAWTTSDDLPSVASVRDGQVHPSSGGLLQRNYSIKASPNGGTYLFAWSLGSRANVAHTVFLLLTLIVILGVVLATYIVLKRLLRPIRDLNEGVKNLADGRLDVVVDARTRNEFGRLAEAFNHMVGRVRAMIASRDQLLSDVSHELRSPITRLRVALELLPAGADRKGMDADVLEMERKVAELLDIERLRSGRGLEFSTQDLVSVIRSVASEFRDRPPRILVESGSTEVALEIDADKVKSVFRNLLENACKYASPQVPVEILVESGEDAVTVRVSDEGPGIPENDGDRVFEPFYRADPSRSKATGGYGLGLSICKRVMQAHGGDIVLDRSRERGASFVLTFPNTHQAGSDDA